MRTTKIKTLPQLAGLDQADPSLVSVVRDHFLTVPPVGSRSLVAGLQEGDGQAAMLDQTYFHERKKGGFFIGKKLK